MLYFAIGQVLNRSTASSILHDCGIESPHWRKVGKLLGLESHILSTAFFKQWHIHAQGYNPSWERLARALDNIQQYKIAAAAAREMAGTYVWQSRAEMEGYSVAYFDRIAAFEAPYR